jgi:Coenzyme PQQ synthesis protein D (PqqD)
MSPEPERFPAAGVPVRNLDVRARNLRGKLLIARGDTAFELDDVAAFIYRHIDGVSTMDQIAAQVAAEYGIPHDMALADGAEFVAGLQATGVVGRAG